MCWRPLTENNASCMPCSPDCRPCTREPAHHHRRRKVERSQRRFRGRPRCIGLPGPEFVQWFRTLPRARCPRLRTNAWRWAEVVHERWLVAARPNRTAVLRPSWDRRAQAEGVKCRHRRRRARGAARTRCDRAVGRRCTCRATLSNMLGDASGRCRPRDRADSSARSARCLRRSTARWGRTRLP